MALSLDALAGEEHGRRTSLTASAEAAVTRRRFSLPLEPAGVLRFDVEAAAAGATACT